MESGKLQRGSVWWVNLDPTQGSEIKKMRPCVLVAPTPINQARRTVLVVPLSSSGSPPHPPITVKVFCMEKSALAVCDQLRAVDKTRLTDWIELMDSKSLDSIGKALQQVLSF
ncbi:MAG: type II toxin-antitoxin system PemK/MazF family toxin [Syntrophobacteraceae bacterium]|nr:type II toxin-antitoxin system PemK/MazF family toxin [Syntrophobacteraceae bacterium]